MRLYPDTKVYVLCPPNYRTGGAEFLHQLCSQLITFGVDAYMLYFVDGSFDLKRDPVADFYRKYHLPYATSFEDNEHNIFVAYEGPTEYLYMPKRAQRAILWMSADNFLHCLSSYLKGLTTYTRLDFTPLPKYFSFHDSDKEMIHFAQSEYSRQFLKVNGVLDYKIYMIEDRINQSYLNRAAHIDLSRKENIVAFNVRKGLEVTQQFIRLAPDIAWRPIERPENMTPAQVQELLERAKIYIDFGNHPGRDRLPREAAVSGCVVITGRRGSAGNDVDINIPAEFKFDERTANPLQVIEKIREVFENFSAAHEKQAAYRARVLDDKNRFVREVAEAFGIKDAEGGGLAILHAVNEEGYYFARALIQSGQFKPKFIVDDAAASAERFSGESLLREQNRNYLRVEGNLVEIITREDAKFLYVEGRIKNFALAEPNDTVLAELKNFYAPALEDVLIVRR